MCRAKTPKMPKTPKWMLKRPPREKKKPFTDQIRKGMVPGQGDATRSTMSAPGTQRGTAPTAILGPTSRSPSVMAPSVVLGG